jgi:hypothetical protein
MSKKIIGAIVGGLLMFIWQTASHTFLDLHGKAEQYTSNQDSIMPVLEKYLQKDGGYYLPRAAGDVSMEEMEKAMEASKGKPWAIIQYHSSQDTNMMMNMGRGLVVDILLAWLLIWLVSKFSISQMGNIVTTALVVGAIVFLNEPYTQHIWYKSFDLYARLMDALISWGLCGAWLGWWLNRKK